MNLRKLLLLFICLFCVALLHAQTFKVDDIEYRIINQNEVEVGKYKYSKKEFVQIPESVKHKGISYSVVGIGQYAFYRINEKYYLKHLSLPKSIRYIDEYALYDNVKLEKIDFADGLKSIGKQAFTACSLKELILPNSVRNIGSRAFSGCSELEKIVIPNSVDSIGVYAFSGCRSLKIIVLPDHGVTIYNDGRGDPQSIEIISCGNGLVNVTGHSVKYPPLLYPNVELPEEFRTIYIYEKSGDNITWWDGSKQQYILSNCTGYTNDFLDKRLPEIKKTFTYQYTYWIKSKIGEWQRKKEYETVAQWKARVTESSRKKEVERLISEARADYIKKSSPKNFSCKIENYDAEGGVYKLKADNLASPFYVKVPVSEAPAFKENFDETVKTPEYCIKDDNLDIASCTFMLNGKKYVSPTIYKDEGTADMALDLPPLTFDSGRTEIGVLVADMIDEEIPSGSSASPNTFAVIIGNETYSKVSKVEYAVNDATVFGKYCSKTLGIPSKNVRSYTDATYGTMMTALRDIRQIAEAYKGNINVIFYYAGHGVPNESSRDAYLLPVDVDGTQTDLCLSVNKLYEELNSLNARSVVVFMDACFSGAQRGEGMLASARGVALKAKAGVPQGNMVVFSAASGDETAYPYKEKGHGLFTYYLLKKLQETKGDVTLGELGRYVVDSVTKESVVSNGKSQTPTVTASESIGMGWKSMKLK